MLLNWQGQARRGDLFSGGFLHFPECKITKAFFIFHIRHVHSSPHYNSKVWKIVRCCLSAWFFVDVVSSRPLSLRNGFCLHQLRNRLVQGLRMRLAVLALHEWEDAMMKVEVNAQACSGAL